MERPTTKQRARIDALIANLESLPTAELISESARLRVRLVDGDLNEAAKKRLRFAIGGAIAIEKILAYIDVLRSLDQQRVATNAEIRRRDDLARALRTTDPVASVRAELEATHLSGVQEVCFHFFAICATRIATYLPIAARAAGYKIPKGDLDVLNAYWPLRHHYEHFEDRLPGGKNDAIHVTETHDADEWRVRLGLELDTLGRFVIDGREIDVTERGLAAIQDVLERTWEKIREKALEEVRKHFSANPSETPDPRDVQANFRVSVGGGPPHDHS